MSDFAKAVKEADEKAERGALAFTLGRFPAYWENEANAAIKRLSDRYNALGGDAGEKPSPNDPGSGS